MREYDQAESDRPAPLLRMHERDAKPRRVGLTEIRRPSYSVVGGRYREDLFEAMGASIDSLEFAGGAFARMPRRRIRELVELCHDNGVTVSTGGFLEYLLTQGPEVLAPLHATRDDTGGHAR